MKFIQAVETTKHETLTKLLQLQREFYYQIVPELVREAAYNLAGLLEPSGSSDDDKWTKVRPQEEVELHIKPLYVTDEFQLEPGSTFIVMGLGTNTSMRSARSDRNRIALTSDNRLSKRFKMTLMNIFDMFDFDCDGLLSRNEYSSFAIATADTPPDDEVAYLNS
ncbi:hypothetical protein OESDEN_15486 [Oesophagostomum dentatum]|uniref:EF-hand domain-containing protein n=1 Tax=Oesophagostomum dentatum TaxID=61180 RepID=A0A0B1SNM2_OESDE|nr:hypothetical protein OESDEN_15486 [Oesophagostomum dentatum]